MSTRLAISNVLTTFLSTETKQCLCGSGAGRGDLFGAGFQLAQAGAHSSVYVAPHPLCVAVSWPDAVQGGTHPFHFLCHRRTFVVGCPRFRCQATSGTDCIDQILAVMVPDDERVGCGNGDCVEFEPCGVGASRRLRCKHRRGIRDCRLEQ